MKFISNTAMAAGAIIAVLAMCCMDSPGTNSYYAGAIVIIGWIITGSGYLIKRLNDRKKHDLYYFRQKDKLDGDLEIIDL